MSLGPFAPRKALDFTTFLDDRIEVDRRDNDGTVIALDADECWKLVHALTSEHPDGGL